MPRGPYCELSKCNVKVFVFGEALYNIHLMIDLPNDNAHSDRVRSKNDANNTYPNKTFTF